MTADQRHSRAYEPIKCRTVFLPAPQPNGFTAQDMRRLLEAGISNFELQDGVVLPVVLETLWHDEARDVIKAVLRSAAPRECAVTGGGESTWTIPCLCRTSWWWPVLPSVRIRLSSNQRTLRRRVHQVLLARGERERRDGRVHLRVVARGPVVCTKWCVPQGTSRRPALQD